MGIPRPRLYLMLLLAMVMLWCFRGWPSADGAYFLAETETLLDRGQLGRETISSNEEAFYRQADNDLYYGQSNEIAMITTLSPFVLTGRVLADILPDSLDRFDALAAPFVAGLHATFFALLAAYLVILLARQAGFDERTALLAALLFGISTPLLHYSGRLFRDPMVAAMVLWALYAFMRWFKHEGKEEGKDGRNGFIMGLAFFALMLTRPPNAVLVAGLVALVVAKKRPRWFEFVGWTMLALVLGFALRLIWTAVMTDGGSADAAVTQGVFAKVFINISGSERLGEVSGAEAWWVPFARLAGMLVSPGAGLIVTAPMALYGSVRAWRVWQGPKSESKHLAGIGLAMLVLTLGGYALYAAWFSGSWGVRYLIPALALPCIFAADGLMKAKLGRPLKLALIGGALVIGVVGTIVNDRPTVRHSPSYQAKVTRLDQVWKPSAMPLYHHSKRVLLAEWTPLEARALKEGWPSARRGVLAGYVVCWAIALRASLSPNLIFVWVIFLLASLALALFLAWQAFRVPKGAKGKASARRASASSRKSKASSKRSSQRSSKRSSKRSEGAKSSRKKPPVK